MDVFVNFSKILCIVSITFSAMCQAAAEPTTAEKKKDAAEAAEDADYQRGVSANVLAECMTKKGDLTPWEKEIKRLGNKYFGQSKSSSKEELARKIYLNFDKIPHKASLEIYNKTHLDKEAIDSFNSKK